MATNLLQALSRTLPQDRGYVVKCLGVIFPYKDTMTIEFYYIMNNTLNYCPMYLHTYSNAYATDMQLVREAEAGVWSL